MIRKKKKTTTTTSEAIRDPVFWVLKLVNVLNSSSVVQLYKQLGNVLPQCLLPIDRRVAGQSPPVSRSK